MAASHLFDRSFSSGVCSCCFAQIALVKGRPKEHPNKHRALGLSICPGSSFASLERSTEGLDWLIGKYDDALGRSRERGDDVNERLRLGRLLHLMQSERERWALFHKENVLVNPIMDAQALKTASTSKKKVASTKKPLEGKKNQHE